MVYHGLWVFQSQRVGKEGKRESRDTQLSGPKPPLTH